MRQIRVPFKRFLLGASLALMTSAAAGASDCGIPFEKTVEALQIHASDIQFPIEKLSFLDEEAVTFEKISLAVEFASSQKIPSDLEISVNGMKVSSRDGGPAFKNGLHKEWVAQLQQMNLNGGLSMGEFLTRLHKNNGEFNLTLQSPHQLVTKARLIFGGRTGNDCEMHKEPPVLKEDRVTIEAVDPAQSPTRSTTMQIRFSKREMDGNFWCSLDNAVAIKCKSPQLYSNLANGTHIFNVYGKNPSNSANPVPSTYKWVVDTIPPVAQITNASTLPTLTNQRSMSFELRATQAGKMFCSLDGKPYAPCASPWVVSGLTEGTHTVLVNVVDLAGNIGAMPARFEWAVDLTPPMVQFFAVSPSSEWNNVNTKSFSFRANEAATLSCSLDAAAFSACESPRNLTNLTEGRHRFEIRAKDLANNTGLVSSYAWTVDLTAPVLSLISATPKPGTTNAHDIAVEFSSSEATEVKCSWDAVVPVVCSSPLVMSQVTEGRHSLKITSRDLAGNLSVPVELSWFMDFTSPMITLGSINPAGSFISTSAWSAKIATSELSTLTVRLNGATVVPNGADLSFTNLTEGHYVLSLVAQDSSGNTSDTLSYEFTVDLTAPILHVASDDTRPLVNIDRRTFTFSASEEVTYQCNVDAAGYSACSETLALSGLADGEHVVLVRATDRAGNISSMSESTWRVDTTTPTTRVTSDQNANNITLTFTSNEPNVSFVCSLDQAAELRCTSGLTLSGLGVGTHQFRVRAMDQAGNLDPVGATITFVTSAPDAQTTITSVDPVAPVTNKQTMTVTFQADQSDVTFQCTFNGATPVPCASPFTLSNLQNGPQDFYVASLNANQQISTQGARYNWTVDLQSPFAYGLRISSASTEISVEWATNEPATSQVFYGVDSGAEMSTIETTDFAVNRIVRLTGLTPDTTYTLYVAGRDAAGNTYQGSRATVHTNP